MCPDDTKYAIEVFCDEIIKIRQMPDSEYIGTSDNLKLIGGIKYWEEVKNSIDNIYTKPNQ